MATLDADDLDAIAARVAALIAGATNISILSPVNGQQALELLRGDSYLAEDTRQLIFSKRAGANWPADMTGGTVVLTISANAMGIENEVAEDFELAIEGEIDQATGDAQAVSFELSAADTESLLAIAHGYDVRIVWTSEDESSVATLWTQTLAVR